MPKTLQNIVAWSESARRYEVNITRPWGTGKLGMQPGGAEWFAWLDEIQTFAFESPAGRFTARKESRQRGGGYWCAYRRASGKLRKKYIGLTPALSLDHLEHIARDLLAPASPEGIKQ